MIKKVTIRKAIIGKAMIKKAMIKTAMIEVVMIGMAMTKMEYLLLKLENKMKRREWILNKIFLNRHILENANIR